ncbi:MAG: porin [Betaproteobacteria bacterium]|nr:porin [Betaproteobacteria bacterium]
MDAGYFMDKSKTGSVEKTQSTFGANPSGSLASNRIGFRGTEKIGDLTAGFHYELGMDAGNTGNLAVGMTNNATGAAVTGFSSNSAGATAQGVRKSTVSLGGGFGTIEAGRNYTPIFNVSCALDAFRCSNINVGKSIYSVIATTRDSGQIQYTLPTMGGLSVSGSFASNVTDETGKPDVGADAYGLSAVYSAGPLSLRAGWAQRKEKGADERTEVIVGGTYMVTKELNVLVTYGNHQLDGSNGAQKAARTGYQIGAQFMISPNTEITGQFGNREDETTSGSVKTKFMGYGLGVVQTLSKRTRLYALWGSDEAKKTGSATVERNQLGVGINHSF